LEGWTIHQDGGGSAGSGSVAAQGIDAVIHEGNSFDVTLSRPVVVGAGTTSLSFMYGGPAFDTGSSGRMKDAFEAALVDAQGRPVVPTFTTGRDAFFNVSEDQPAAYGQGTTARDGTVTVDLSSVLAGTSATLVF